MTPADAMLTGPNFHEEHTLDDGTPVVLRHIRPEDEADLKSGFERLSTASRYSRFHGIVNELTPKTLHYLTHVDGRDHVAIVATTVPHDGSPPAGLGVARFVRSKDHPSRAEVALTVIDEAQHKGLGRILGVAIARAAAERGVRRFVGPGLRDNVALRSLLDEVGARVHPTDDGIEFEIDLLPDPRGVPLEAAIRRFLRFVASSARGHRPDHVAHEGARKADDHEDGAAPSGSPIRHLPFHRS